MRPYETAFLIAPNLPEEDNEKLIDQMADIVSKNKGKMINIDNWGKRRLAYPIHKYEEAYYVFFLYEGEPAVLSELERRFKQTEAVLRYLTVRTEVKESVKKKGRAAPKRKKKETAARKEPPPTEIKPEDDKPAGPSPEDTGTDTSTPEVVTAEEKVSDEKETTPPVEGLQEETPAEEEIKEEA